MVDKNTNSSNFSALSLSPDKISLISFLERKSFHIWPSAEVQEFGGWSLRHDASVSYRRCNSAYAGLNHVSEPLDSLLEHVYHSYTQTGKTPFIYTTELSQPSGLQQKLRESNRVHFSLKTDVMVIQEPLTTISLQKTVLPEDITLSIINHEDDEEMMSFFKPYSASFGKAKNEEQAYVHFFKRLGQKLDTSFLLLQKGTEPIGCGIGIDYEGIYGVFAMGVNSPFRNKGYGGLILNELLLQGLKKEAGTIYLQVMADNPAVRLYQRVGFEKLYSYEYYEVGPKKE
jgi:ribosomal protein S18 acetylase RimI-like enzyme